MASVETKEKTAAEGKEEKKASLVRGLDDEGLDGPVGGEVRYTELVDDKKLVPYEQLTVASALGALAARDLFADVSFLVGTGADQRVIPAHRIIMAAGSEIFEAMLFPPKFPGDADTKDAKLPAQIAIPDVKPSIFRTMLQVIYSDTATIKAEDLTDLIACANKFQLESLRLLCVTFMEEGVTADNACKLFETAEKLPQEKSLVLNYIEENAEEVAKSSGWDTLPKERLLVILESNKLAIDEVDLFRAVTRWGSCELKRQGLLDTPDNKRAILADILTKIRFPTMTMEDIATHVSPSSIMTPGQLLEIFTYVGQVDKKSSSSSIFAAAKKAVTWPTQPRIGSKEKWTLSSDLKSSTITLSQGGLTITNTGSSYAYALGTMPWTRGKHAWRVVRDTNPTGWLFLGVSRKVAHQNASYNDSTCWGLSSASQRYFQGAATSMTSNFSTGPLDVIYDADAGTLTIINVSLVPGGGRYELTGLPTGAELVPHFTPNGSQQLSIYPINVRDAGSKSLVVRRPVAK